MDAYCTTSIPYQDLKDCRILLFVKTQTTALRILPKSTLKSIFEARWKHLTSQKNMGNSAEL